MQPPTSPFVSRRPLSLSRPYPLALAVVLDLTISLLFLSSLSIPLLVLSATRVLSLGYLTTSPRWKTQRALLLSTTLATLLVCTWEATAPLLRRTEGVKTSLLLLTSGIAILEYLFLLLLVRLTPTPFAPRPIPDLQSPISPHLTPLGGPSRAAPLFDTPQLATSLPSVSSFGPVLGPRWNEEAFDAEMGLASPYESHDEHSECSECSDCSSVSESSIIDLPRPKPPAPIMVDSASMNALAALAEGPVALVRRSTSARILGRSVDSGYGTFE